MIGSLVGQLQAVWQPLWEWGAAMSMQLVVVLVIVAAIDRVIGQRARPQFVAAVWLLVFIKLVIPPTWSSPFSIGRVVDVSFVQPSAPEVVPVLGDGATSGTSSSPTIASSVGDFVDGELNAASSVGPAAGFSVPRSLRSSLVAIWFAGVLLVSSLAIRRYRSSRSMLVNRARAAPRWLDRLCRECALRVGLRRHRVRVLVDAKMSSARLVGCVHPVIVIPHDLLSRRDQLEHVLLHELTHLRRGDPWWALATLALHVVYWFHPLVYVARRRLETLREASCDHDVAQLLGDEQPAYRRTLLELAGARFAAVEAHIGIGVLRRPSQILTRLRWLDRPAVRATRSRRVSAAMFLLVVFFACLPLDSRPVRPAPSVRNGSPIGALSAEPLAPSSSSVSFAGSPAVHVDRPERQTRSLTRRNSSPTASLEPLAAPIEIGPDAIDDLEGCLQRRYLVLGLLAQRSAGVDDRDDSNERQGD